MYDRGDMTSLTHQMVALLSGFFVLTLFPVQVGPGIGIAVILAVMIGALTPDLDHPAANLWNRMIGSNTLSKLFQVFSGGHRHLTHSFVGINGIWWLLWQVIHRFIQPQYAESLTYVWIAFMIGYISHSVADTITDRGVPWFWPFQFSIKLPPGPEELRVTTGSFVEIILLRGGIIISIFFLLSSHWFVLASLFR